MAGRTGSCRVCLPVPVTKPPVNRNWIHEIKHDGFRMVVRRDAGCRSAFSKRKRPPTEGGLFHSTKAASSDYCTPSMAKERNFPYFSPIWRCSLNCGSLREA